MNHFVKRNATAYSDALIKEANGLRRLDKTVDDAYIKIPEVISVNESQLVITNIDRSQCSIRHSEQLGRGLAAMHKQQQDYYGFEEDNYIGLNPQINDSSASWGDFFVKQRLQVQINLIQNANQRAVFDESLGESKNKLIGFLDEHCKHPSLVHGDLWSGNYLCDADNVWLIDPAVYFADREVDIAMTEMFGGFSPAFYQAYDEEYQRSDVYTIKKPIYNLYHYLNHYNLFGESYLTGCNEGWRAISRL